MEARTFNTSVLATFVSSFSVRNPSHVIQSLFFFLHIFPTQVNPKNSNVCFSANGAAVKGEPQVGVAVIFCKNRALSLSLFLARNLYSVESFLQRLFLRFRRFVFRPDYDIIKVLRRHSP